MKKHLAFAVVGFLGILAGILVNDILKPISVLLIVIGIGLLLVSFLDACKKHADKCPRCGTVLYRSMRIYREKRDGLIRCPHCRSLVRIE